MLGYVSGYLQGINNLYSGRYPGTPRVYTNIPYLRTYPSTQIVYTRVGTQVPPGCTLPGSRFRTAVPFFGQISWNLTGLAPATGLQFLKGWIKHTPCLLLFYFFTLLDSDATNSFRRLLSTILLAVSTLFALPFIWCTFCCGSSTSPFPGTSCQKSCNCLVNRGSVRRLNPSMFGLSISIGWSTRGLIYYYGGP